MSSSIRRPSAGSRLANRWTTAALDLGLMMAAFALPPLGSVQSPPGLPHALLQVPLVLAVQFTALYMSGALAFVWKYVGMGEVPAFIRSALGSGAVLLVLRLWLPESLADLRIPISIIIMATLSAFGGLLGIRVARRSLWEWNLTRGRAAQNGGRSRPPVLLVGAGAAGVMAVREIRSRGEHDMELRGFVDDDPTKQGR
jgi:FlaA1/EpsC-like NDP-sugar epimerase